MVDTASQCKSGPPAADRPTFDARETTVIRLLEQGCTDDAVARRLGLSDRTVRRMTASLMSKLGARSRFEAGVRAAQLGLV